jgi:hypothetical protein
LPPEFKSVIMVEAVTVCSRADPRTPSPLFHEL